MAPMPPITPQGKGPAPVEVRAASAGPKPVTPGGASMEPGESAGGSTGGSPRIRDAHTRLYLALSPRRKEKADDARNMRKMNLYNGNDPGFFSSMQRATAIPEMRASTLDGYQRHGKGAVEETPDRVYEFSIEGTFDELQRPSSPAREQSLRRMSPQFVSQAPRLESPRPAHYGGHIGPGWYPPSNHSFGPISDPLESNPSGQTRWAKWAPGRDRGRSSSAFRSASPKLHVPPPTNGAHLQPLYSFDWDARTWEKGNMAPLFRARSPDTYLAKAKLPGGPPTPAPRALPDPYWRPTTAPDVQGHIYETDCFVKPSCSTAVRQSPMKLSAVFKSSINRFQDPKSIFARPVGPQTYADSWFKVNASRVLNGKSLNTKRSHW